MAGEIKSRSMKIVLTLSEVVEGNYGDKTVAEQTLTVPLPTSARAIADAVGMAVTSMGEQVVKFRGPVQDAAKTAVVKD